jgi:SAM-dependent methyltransferase
MDERENDRNDLQHHKFTLLLNDKLYAVPIPDSQLNNHNSRILDIGTGTGIWAIDMADKFPNADVTGVDLAPAQPNFTPPNCFFEIDDIEEDWEYAPNHFDFIHGRDLLTAVRDWPRLLGQAFEHLKPGGWIQLASTIPDIQSDDNTLPANSNYLEAGRLYFEMAEKMGTPLDSPRKWRQQMLDAGFDNVRDVVYKIPMGTWPRSRRLRVVGRLEQMMLMEGFEAFMLRGYVQILGGKEEDLAVVLTGARREITDPRVHTYVYFHITYGRKPELSFGSSST